MDTTIANDYRVFCILNIRIIEKEMFYKNLRYLQQVEEVEERSESAEGSDRESIDSQEELRREEEERERLDRLYGDTFQQQQVTYEAFACCVQHKPACRLYQIQIVLTKEVHNWTVCIKHTENLYIHE